MEEQVRSGPKLSGKSRPMVSQATEALKRKPFCNKERGQNEMF